MSNYYEGFKWKFSNPVFQHLNLTTRTVDFNELDDFQNSEFTNKKLLLDGIDSHRNRLKYMGGIDQQDRMIFDKRRSLDRALLYSYQACNIKRISTIEDDAFSPREYDKHDICRCLINPDKNKMDYDDKILSVHYEEDYHPGDVFEWIGTNTYWMIYLQDLDERAYFRGEIRRCDNEIMWETEDGLKSTYAAIRGPVETKINYIQKHQISVDTPNYSLNILMPRNKDNLEYFRRYSKFYLKNREEGAMNVCWRVEAIDWISTPGILEVTAVEYYANKDEDDIEQGIAGAMVVKNIDPNPEEVKTYIHGEVFIKPRIVYDYYFKGIPTGEWSIEESNVPVRFEIDPEDSLHVRLIWKETFSGKFHLKYGKLSKEINVQSLL